MAGGLLMPAISPERLQSEIAEALALQDSPERFARALVALLDRYRDRTRRLDLASESHDVPKPIVRSIRLALRRCSIADEARWREGARHLWQSGVLAAKAIASEMLLRLPLAERLAFVETWARAEQDDDALRVLAETGLKALDQEDAAHFETRLAAWLASKRSSLRRLALHALRAAVGRTDYDDLPTVFRLLEGYEPAARGLERRALLDAVEALAARSPAETAGFLIERAQHEGWKDGLLRQAADALPLNQAARVMQALRRRA